MKSLTVLACSLMFCSCADMLVTRTYNTSSHTTTEVDAKDFGSTGIRY
jgi:hypothetical protein